MTSKGGWTGGWWSAAGAMAAVMLMAATAEAKTSWQLVYNQPNQGNALLDVAAVDGTHGWAVGVASGMGSSSPVGVRTTDGTSWNMLPLPQTGGGPLDFTFFTQLAFTDADHGWLAAVSMSMGGEQPRLFRTEQGGMTWTELTAPSTSLTHLQALPTGQLYGVGGSTLVSSADGAAFQEVAVPVPGGLELAAIHMLNPDCGFVLASSESSAAVLWSGDGGQGWEVRAEGLPYELNRLWFVSASLGWAAGTDASGAGVVVRTSDGGASWTAATMPDHPGAMGEPAPVTSCEAVRFFDDSRGVALCLSCTGNCDNPEETPSYVTFFGRSSDGGQSWTMDPDYEPQMNAPPFGEMMRFSGMFAMAFPEPNVGFLAGQNNLILRYDADEPEPAGWGPASCDPGSSGGGGSSSSGSSSGANGDDDDDSEADSGCGCRHAGARSAVSWALWALALIPLGLGWRRRSELRRRSE